MRALSPLTEFALLARVHDDALDLERLAISIGRIGTPDLVTAEVSAALDRLAELVSHSVDLGAPPDLLARQLASCIGATHGFRGDTARFDEPESSYLHEVLERRTGLPILLAVVWILVGRRLGLPIFGVSYPGHFLACLDAPGARIYLDPFRGGDVRDIAELTSHVDPRDRRVLEPVSVRPIVVRMLANLKHLWVEQRAYASALGAVDRILLIAGEVPLEVRDRGLLGLHLGAQHEAIRDLSRYIHLAPEAPDHAEVTRIIAEHSET